MMQPDSAVALVTRRFPKAAPDWLLLLAQEVDRTNQSKAARRIDYTPSVISQVLKGSYRGNLENVEAAVRGALGGETVECPVLGEISLHICIREQKRPLRPSSTVRIRTWRHCHGVGVPKCPHSRTGDGQ